MVLGGELPSDLYTNSLAHVEVRRSTNSITGVVSDTDGKGLSGVSLNLTGPDVQTAITVGGNYSFYHLSACDSYTYTVTPLVPNRTFNPSSETIPCPSGNRTANFTAAGAPLIVLLPNEDETSGSIVVTNAGGSQQLTEANTALKVERADAAPSKPFPMDPAEVQRLFQSTLSISPTPGVRFNLYFPTGGTDLTAESGAILPRIFQAYKQRRSTDVAVIGHTDTTGDNESNFRLGLARAAQIRKMLEALGVNGSHIFTESHGERDLLVPTKDNVSERRNRCVEVIVR